MDPSIEDLHVTLEELWHARKVGASRLCIGALHEKLGKILEKLTKKNDIELKERLDGGNDRL